ncbi:hypothetical protein SAMN05421858_4621 [Haladaptatus litoreus]|uniref:Uncharacterized protein n=1 Tax=Haladaptatus litoreus TaxID=553468 RepID=A0A1N7EYJ6_9EURY|nr:hypothetical protein SAMN05421858_4621 [Haladaptatus litoreus]
MRDKGRGETSGVLIVVSSGKELRHPLAGRERLKGRSIEQLGPVADLVPARSDCNRRRTAGRR